MAYTAAEVLSEARAGLLNDPTGAIYPDPPMIVLLNKVYKELQTKVSALGIGTTKEATAAVPVNAGVTRLGDGAGLPTGLLFPIHIKERAKGSLEDYIDMDETDFEPDIRPDIRMKFWSWREDEIKFPGATTDRELLINHVKSLGEISDVNSPILIINAQQWLAQRLAAVASATIGHNPKRGAILQGDLVTLWSDLSATLIKRRQAIPVRRRRTRYRVPLSEDYSSPTTRRTKEK